MNRASSECFGCRACEQVCINNCINMVNDSEGFLIPIVNFSSCNKCGACISKCPIERTDIPCESKCITYAMKIMNRDILKDSASGGAFPMIAITVLSKNGYVYGAAYCDELYVKHIGINSISELYKLQSSKYVQSDTGNTYIEVKEKLELNHYVVYSGTPCQIAGLRAFLGKDYERLLTVDIICHGTPSPLLFKKYLGFLENKGKSKILRYNFRCKKLGWGLYYSYYFNRSDSITGAGRTDPYYKNFLLGNTYREICYSCKYANKNRVGDITIGDYWGVEKHHPEFSTKDGVSLVIANTEKGRVFINEMKEHTHYLESNINIASLENNNLYQPTNRPRLRNEIYNGILEMSDSQYIKQRLMPQITVVDKLRSYVPHLIINFYHTIKRFIVW